MHTDSFTNKQLNKQQPTNTFKSKVDTALI